MDKINGAAYSDSNIEQEEVSSDLTDHLKRVLPTAESVRRPPDALPTEGEIEGAGDRRKSMAASQWSAVAYGRTTDHGQD